VTDIIPMDAESALPVVMPDFGDFHSPLNEEEARSITDTIRNAVDVVWMLIARAHAGGAWSALGYETWAEYVQAEFNMSRSRSYQLLDQARVVAEIEAALPEGTTVSITEAAARDLKGVLEEVVPEIRERTAGLEPDEASDVLAEIVEEQRERIRERQAEQHEEDFEDGYMGGGNGGTYNGGDDPEPLYEDIDGVDVVAIRQAVNAAHDLYSSLSALAGLPDDLEDVVNIIPRERYPQIDENLAGAQENLRRFADLWEAHREDNE
jgi:hypothetical protein